MLDYLRRSPGVRDVVVSGGDVANMPWPRLEAFLTELLEIENIRDIRLATKALMGLPQHWLQPEVVEGMTRIGATRAARGVSVAIHTHVNHANSVTPLVAEATRAMLDTGIRDVRNQGVILNGVNADPHALLDLCFRLLDGAQIMPYYFYMCDMIPFSEHWRVSVADAQRLQHAIMGYLPGFATPRIVCDVPFVGKRWIHQLEDYDTERGISGWTKNYRTSIEAEDAEALPAPTPTTTRSTRCPASGQAWWAEHARDDDTRAQGRRDGRGVATAGGAPGALRLPASTAWPERVMARHPAPHGWQPARRRDGSERGGTMRSKSATAAWRSCSASWWRPTRWSSMPPGRSPVARSRTTPSSPRTSRTTRSRAMTSRTNVLTGADRRGRCGRMQPTSPPRPSAPRRPGGPIAAGAATLSPPWLFSAPTSPGPPSDSQVQATLVGRVWRPARSTVTIGELVASAPSSEYRVSIRAPAAVEACLYRRHPALAETYSNIAFVQTSSTSTSAVPIITAGAESAADPSSDGLCAEATSRPARHPPVTGRFS